MVHGSPDYFNVGPMELFYSVFDLAELAARLGCPSRIDRRGKVVWYDDFSRGDGAWYKGGTPPGGYIGVATFPCVSPGGSLYLNAGTTPYLMATARTYLTPPMTPRYGIEWYWTHSDIAGIQLMYLLRTKNQQAYWFDVYYAPSETTVYIAATGTDAREVYHFVGAELYTQVFHNYKLVLDDKALSGVRLIIDGVEIDISDYVFRTEAMDVQDSLSVAFTVFNYDVTNGHMNVDNVIYTMGE